MAKGSNSPVVGGLIAKGVAGMGRDSEVDSGVDVAVPSPNGSKPAEGGMLGLRGANGLAKPGGIVDGKTSGDPRGAGDGAGATVRGPPRALNGSLGGGAGCCVNADGGGDETAANGLSGLVGIDGHARPEKGSAAAPNGLAVGGRDGALAANGSVGRGGIEGLSAPKGENGSPGLGGAEAPFPHPDGSAGGSGRGAPNIGGMVLLWATPGDGPGFDGWGTREAAVAGGDAPAGDETRAPPGPAEKTWLHLLQRIRTGPAASLSSPTLKRVWQRSHVMITS